MSAAPRTTGLVLDERCLGHRNPPGDKAFGIRMRSKTRGPIRTSSFVMRSLDGRPISPREAQSLTTLSGGFSADTPAAANPECALNSSAATQAANIARWPTDRNAPR